MKFTKQGILNFIKWFCIFILTIILAAVLFLVGVIYIFEKGPSPEVRDIFVVTVQQSSAAKPLANLFLSKELVAQIMDANTVDEDELEDTDTDLIDVDPALDKNAIIIEDVHGSTYNGKMMIINDPSRVYVMDIPDYNAAWGMTVSDMVKSQNAIAGVNGGGFSDNGGLGNGTLPLGIVMSKGVWKSGDMGAYHQVIGLDNNNKLVVAGMTGYEAINRGIRDAVEWGPALVVNGKAVSVGDGGLNPRTAIGQRADGAILLLCIDGRQPSSIGAGYNDLIGIMLSYGAVNAANLDGGNSSSMVYDGKVISNTASLYGEREIPTFVLVRR